MLLRAEIGLFIYLISVSASGCWAMDILEFFLGPKLGRSVATPKSLQRPAAQDLVEGFGYPFEAHEVSSHTGYILSLHRLPYGKKSKQSNGTKRPVALFQHGLASASDMWLFQGPNVNLPYILADAGYDVWMSNMRGNIYSKAHKILNPDRDQTFWEFSLHEVAYYDLPVIIDYILNLTDHSSLYYLGHSVGSTVGMLLCTLRPEYNSKIILHLALAPLVYVTHTIPVPQKIALMPSVPMVQTALANNIFNIFPRRPYFTKIIQMVCREGTTIQHLCISWAFLIVGTDYEQFDLKYFSSMTTYFPAGTSTYLVQHTLQIYLNGTLAALDYGDNDTNYKKYNQDVPPLYNLSAVTHPVSLHYGNGDLLVTEKDIDFIEKQLPNPVGKFPVPFRTFNHIDFVWGIDAKKLVYDRVILIMDKYR